MKNRENMKRKIVGILGGLLMAIGAWFLKGNIQIDYTADVLAATDTSAVSTACTDPTATGFIPDIAYTVTWAAPAAGTAPALGTATGVLTGPVMSDSNPTVTPTLNGGGAPAGFVVLTHQSPFMKLDGLACQAVSQASLQAQGDGADNASFDIAISNLADVDTGYTAADKVDEDAVADTLFGTSGQIQVGLVTDASDRTSTTNSMVEFGGAVEANGGSEMHVIIDVTNYDPQAGTDVETLTFTITGS